MGTRSLSKRAFAVAFGWALLFISFVAASTGRSSFGDQICTGGSFAIGRCCKCFRAHWHWYPHASHLRRRRLHHQTSEGYPAVREGQAAMEALILVATLGGPTMFARNGMLQALNRHVERVFNPNRTAHLCGQRKRQSEVYSLIAQSITPQPEAWTHTHAGQCPGL